MKRKIFKFDKDPYNKFYYCLFFSGKIHYLYCFEYYSLKSRVLAIEQ